MIRCYQVDADTGRDSEVVGGYDHGCIAAASFAELEELDEAEVEDDGEEEPVQLVIDSRRQKELTTRGIKNTKSTRDGNTDPFT